MRHFFRRFLVFFSVAIRRYLYFSKSSTRSASLLPLFFFFGLPFVEEKKKEKIASATTQRPLLQVQSSSQFIKTSSPRSRVPRGGERTPWMRLLLPLHLLVHKKKRRRRRRLKTKTGRKEYTRSHRPRSSFSSSFSSRFSLEKVLRRSVGGCRLQSSSTKTLRRQQKTRKLSSKTISFPNLPAERK